MDATGLVQSVYRLPLRIIVLATKHFTDKLECVASGNQFRQIGQGQLFAFKANNFTDKCGLRFWCVALGNALRLHPEAVIDKVRHGARNATFTQCNGAVACIGIFVGFSLARTPDSSILSAILVSQTLEIMGASHATIATGSE